MTSPTSSTQIRILLKASSPCAQPSALTITPSKPAEAIRLSASCRVSPTSVSARRMPSRRRDSRSTTLSSCHRGTSSHAAVRITHRVWTSAFGNPAEWVCRAGVGCSREVPGRRAMSYRRSRLGAIRAASAASRLPASRGVVRTVRRVPVRQWSVPRWCVSRAYSPLPTTVSARYADGLVPIHTRWRTSQPLNIRTCR